MADVVVARIQNRKGLRRDLPQPLAPGEIGLCIDTGEMFIGNDPTDPNSYMAPVIEAYTPSIANTQLINTYCSTQIVQVDMDDPLIGVDEGDITVQANGRAYIGYSVAPGSLPGLDLGPERWVTDVSADPTNEFIQGTLALDGSIYNVADAGAISEVINFVDTSGYVDVGDATGIVTVSQNIQVWTRLSDINMLSDNIVIPALRLPLPTGLTDGWIPIPQLSYDVRDVDTFVVEYSLAGNPSADVSTSSTHIPFYSRTGTMRITTTTSGAIMTDIYTEIDETTANTEFMFKVEKTDNIVTLYYNNSGIIISSEQFYFSTTSRRWQGFASTPPVPVTPPEYNTVDYYNPADKDASIILIDNNTTIVRDTGTTKGVRSTLSRSTSGRYQIRFTFDNAENPLPEDSFIGIANSAVTLGGIPTVGSAGSMVLLNTEGDVNALISGKFNDTPGVDFSENVSGISRTSFIDMYVNLNINEVVFYIDGIQAGSKYSIPDGVDWFVYTGVTGATGFLVVADFIGETYIPANGFYPWNVID